MDIERFFFGQPELFLVPIEHLSPFGMTPAFARSLRAARGMSEAWVEAFNRSFSTYWSVQSLLYRRAPRTQLPPRTAHICVVTSPERVRPHYEPIHRSSYFVYAADFEPETSTPELSAFLLAFADRLSLLRDLGLTVVACLPWLLARDREALQGLREGCLRTRRPDAEAFRQLGAALDDLSGLRHGELLPPAPHEVVGGREVSSVGLVVPAPLVPVVDALSEAFRQEGARALERHLARYAERASEPGEQLCAWLRQRHPDMLIVGPRGDILWDPEKPEDSGQLKDALRALTDAASASIRADLEVAWARTQAFVSALRDPDVLRPPSEALDEAGGIYIDRPRRLLAYALAQPGIEALLEPAPPYRRWLIAARAVHEWAHLAVEAGLVPVPREKRAAHDLAHAALAEILARIVGRLPGALRNAASDELQALATAGLSLADLPLRRMDDYRANLLMRHFLAPEESEAYLRVNVRTLAREPGGILVKLVRYAYEAQYVRLCRVRDPLGYFLSSTSFGAHYITSGIVQNEDALALLGATAALCATYEVDWSAFVSQPER